MCQVPCFVRCSHAGYDLYARQEIGVCGRHYLRFARLLTHHPWKCAEMFDGWREPLDHGGRAEVTIEERSADFHFISALSLVLTSTVCRQSVRQEYFGIASMSPGLCAGSAVCINRPDESSAYVGQSDGLQSPVCRYHARIFIARQTDMGASDEIIAIWKGGIHNLQLRSSMCGSRH